MTCDDCQYAKSDLDPDEYYDLCTRVHKAQKKRRKALKKERKRGKSKLADDAEELLAELVATITELAVKPQVSRLAAVLQAAEQLAEQQMQHLTAQ
jgi:hypothetical protein